jgi:hypoxanthine phosphoribosyltransferase
MQHTIKIWDKEFTVLISQERIQERIVEMARAMHHDLAGTSPVFVTVLNGAFLFAADLLRQIDLPCEVSFVRLSSYAGTRSTGTVQPVIGLKEDLRGRTVVLLEDIIDSGDTAAYLLQEMKKHQPGDLRLASLLFKPHALKQPVHADYVGFEIPNDFVVGYGLDYNGLGRNLNAIYTLVP